MISFIDVPTFVAALVSAIIAEEVRRRRKRSLQAIDEEIEWYRDLRAIVTKIRTTAKTARTREEIVDSYYENDRYIEQRADKIPYDVEEIAKQDFRSAFDEDEYELYEHLDDMELDGESFWKRWWKYDTRKRHFESLERAGRRMNIEIDEHLFDLNEHMAKNPGIDSKLGTDVTELIAICHEIVVTKTNGLFEGNYHRIEELCLEITRACDENIEELEAEKKANKRIIKYLKSRRDSDEDAQDSDIENIKRRVRVLAEEAGFEVDQIIQNEGDAELDFLIVSEDFEGMDYHNRVREILWDVDYRQDLAFTITPLTPDQFKRRKHTDRDVETATVEKKS